MKFAPDAIYSAIGLAVSAVCVFHASPTLLDFGCGHGRILFLVSSGCHVFLASDIMERCMACVASHRFELPSSRICGSSRSSANVGTPPLLFCGSSFLALGLDASLPPGFSGFVFLPGCNSSCGFPPFPCCLGRVFSSLFCAFAPSIPAGFGRDPVFSF